MKSTYRTHQKIVRDWGPAELTRLINDSREPERQLSKMTTNRWAERSSIPSAFWKILSDNEVATLEELAAGAASDGS